LNQSPLLVGRIEATSNIVFRLDAVIRGDARPFDGEEFRRWRAKRERENRKN
jgi:hypothetical protein